MEFRKLCAGCCSGAIVIGAAVLLSTSGQPAAFQAKAARLRRHHRPMEMFRKRDQTTAESYNWSGYAVTGAKGSVSAVTASWIVPAVSCSSALDDTSGAAAFWVGIDGWTSTTVEQIGTDSDCATPSGAASTTPTYYAWYEFYPQNSYYIGNPNTGFRGYVVQPGDVMAAEVKANGGGSFTVILSDTTKGWTFLTTSNVPNAQQTSAEWITETPYGCKTQSGYCEFPDFGTIEYGNYYTPVPATCYAIVGNAVGPIGAFGSAVQEAIMVNNSNPSIYMATPSALTGPFSAPGTSFTVTWGNPGP